MAASVKLWSGLRQVISSYGERLGLYSASLTAVVLNPIGYLRHWAGAVGRVVREWRPRGPGVVSNKLMCLVHYLEHPKGSLLLGCFIVYEVLWQIFQVSYEVFYIYSP